MNEHENPSSSGQEAGGSRFLWFTRRLRRGRGWWLAALGLLAAGVTLALFFKGADGSGGARAEAVPAAARQTSEQARYYCPMHPHYVSDRPGHCPVCSMKLVEKEKAPTAPGPAAGTAPPGAAEKPAGAPAPPQADTVFIAPQRQQLIGVQSVTAEVRPLVREIRAVGKVAFDESRVTHLHTKVTGYIERVFVDSVGRPVRKGEPLFTIYSPELVATQEEYLLALKSRSALKDSTFPWVSSGASQLLEATRRRLQLWDISDPEIEAIEKEGKVRRELTIYSPVTGIVTERAAYHHGRYVSPEMDLYTIVDLSRVWVLAEVYEYELPYVKPDQLAEIVFPYSASPKTLRGRISYIYPYLNEKTRTAQVRLEFANPGGALRPDLFVNVLLRSDLGRRLAVPEDAVLDTGTERYVFVDRGEGYFEPRAVEVGAEAGGFYAIESGLKAGERVVTAANFLLDSESRLKGALAGLGKPASIPSGQAAAAPGGAGAVGENLSIAILEPKEPKASRNLFRVAVRDAAGNPLDGAEVEVKLFMPSMGTMPPMTASARLRPIGGGEYKGFADIPASGTWQTTVTARKGGAVLGATQTSITAR